MNLSFTIAKRYLLGKKSHNIINIISMVSVSGVMIGSMALIIVLSVFNGFGDLVISLYDTFDPDIKITVHEGKTFSASAINLEEIKKTEGIKFVSLSLEENALVKCNDRQFIATVKGVDDEFLKVSSIEKKIIDGNALLHDEGKNFAIVGSGVAYALSLNLQAALSPLSVFVPDKNAGNILTPEEAFKNLLISAGGVFSVQQDFDSKYILVPISFMHELLDEPEKISSIEIALNKNSDEGEVKQKLISILGKNYDVKTRLEQHELLYKILKSEKWAVFLILSFIMIIGIFNILGTLTMLVIEKKHDIQTLKNMGASLKLVQNIFLIEGILITVVGIISGIVLGWLICFVQQRFGIVKLGNADAFVVDAYPVSLEVMDFVYVFCTVFFIGAIASWITSNRLVKRVY